MKALFLSPNVPFPPENGGHHRNLGLIRALARFASVEVFAIGDPADSRGALAREHLAALGATLSVHAPTGPGPCEDDAEDLERLPDAVSHFRSPALAQALSRRLAASSVDVVHVEELVMAQYAPACPCARVVDRHKVDFAYHAAMARVVSAGSDEHLREAARFLSWERRLAGGFDRILVPGEGDRRLLEPLNGAGSVSLVPIAIADELAPPAEADRRVDHALIYGARDYGPNVEAQRWFFEEVWPRVRAAEPTMRAFVVGSGRPPLAAEPPPRDAGVEELGFVPEIRDILQGPGALVVGVRVGGGARTKILEALACGMPVVSSAIGVENLGLVPGRDFLPAETAAEAAAALLRLHREPALAARLAREGPRRAEPYRWSRVEPTVEAVYRDVLARAAAHGPRHAARAESHAATVDSPELARLAAELDALRRRADPGLARRGWRRLERRLRRSAPVVGAERVAARLLDVILAPPAGGLAGRVRGTLVRALRALRRGP